MPGETKKLTVRVPAEQAEWLKIVAAKNDVSVAELLRQIVTGYLTIDRTSSSSGRFANVEWRVWRRAL